MMDPNDLLIGSTLDIPGKIVGFFQTILDMITSVLSALQTLYTTLQDFDNMIINMADSNGSSQFSGMPVVEAIGTFRYLVGDVAFLHDLSHCPVWLFVDDLRPCHQTV